MIAARVLNACHAGLDRAATVLLVAADWCQRTAWQLDPDPAFDDVCESINWMEGHDYQSGLADEIRKAVANGWPLDPDGYHVDGTHESEQ